MKKQMTMLFSLFYIGTIDAISTWQHSYPVLKEQVGVYVGGSAARDRACVIGQDGYVRLHDKDGIIAKAPYDYTQFEYDQCTALTGSDYY